MSMTNKDYTKLEEAVDRYVDGLDLSALIQIVTDDIWAYYRKNADEEEIHEFIEAMQVSDSDE